MRAVLTRVKSASVAVDGKTIGQIGQGFLILLGITHEDTEAQAVKLADKLVGLRIFEDEDGKMNRGLETVGGEILVVSQFTLYGNCRKGRRPDFLAAARPEVAIPLYEKFVALCREKGFHTETGEFGRRYAGPVRQRRPSDPDRRHRPALQLTDMLHRRSISRLCLTAFFSMRSPRYLPHDHSHPSDA